MQCTELIGLILEEFQKTQWKRLEKESEQHLNHQTESAGNSITMQMTQPISNGLAAVIVNINRFYHQL